MFLVKKELLEHSNPPNSTLHKHLKDKSKDLEISAARLAILSPEFVDSGELELHLAIRNLFRL